MEVVTEQEQCLCQREIQLGRTDATSHVTPPFLEVQHVILKSQVCYCGSHISVNKQKAA